MGGRYAILFSLLLVGCATPVRIDSRPDGARCYVEDSFVGYTPVELHLSSASRGIRLERDGFRTVTATLRRRFDIRSLGLIPVFPVMLFPRFTTRLEERYLIELQLGDGAEDRGVVDGIGRTAEDAEE